MPTHILTQTYQNTWPTTTKEGTLCVRAPTSKTDEGGLNITPVLANGDAWFGAEVEGVDWSQPISKAIVDVVR